MRSLLQTMRILKRLPPNFYLRESREDCEIMVPYSVKLAFASSKEMRGSESEVEQAADGLTNLGQRAKGEV